MSEGITEEQKVYIDGASYEDLLREWRFSPIGNPAFDGERGEYFAKVMWEKKELCDHVAASKRVGWT